MSAAVEKSAQICYRFGVVLFVRASYNVNTRHDSLTLSLKLLAQRHASAATNPATWRATAAWRPTRLRPRAATRRPSAIGELARICPPPPPLRTTPPVLLLCAAIILCTAPPVEAPPPPRCANLFFFFVVVAVSVAERRRGARWERAVADVLAAPHRMSFSARSWWLPVCGRAGVARRVAGGGNAISR